MRDGFLECGLDEDAWDCLSDFEKYFDKENTHVIRDDKRISLGSVLLICEYTFKDLDLDDNLKKENMRCF